MNEFTASTVRNRSSSINRCWMLNRSCAIFRLFLFTFFLNINNVFIILLSPIYYKILQKCFTAMDFFLVFYGFIRLVNKITSTEIYVDIGYIYLYELRLYIYKITVYFTFISNLLRYLKVVFPARVNIVKYMKIFYIQMRACARARVI